MTPQEVPDDLRPGDIVGGTTLTQNDFRDGILQRREMWSFLLSRTPTIVRSPRTSSPTEGGQPAMRNMSSRDPLQRNLTKDFTPPQEESEEEDEDDSSDLEDVEDDVEILETRNTHLGTQANNNNNNNNNNTNNNNGNRNAPPQRPSIEELLRRPVVASEAPHRELAAADRERLRAVGVEARQQEQRLSEGTRTEPITIESDGDDETDDDYDDGYATADDYGDDDDVFAANVDGAVHDSLLTVLENSSSEDSFDDEEDGFDEEEDVQRYLDEEEAAYELGVHPGFEEAAAASPLRAGFEEAGFEEAGAASPPRNPRNNARFDDDVGAAAASPLRAADASPPRNPRNNARFDDDVGDGERDERPVRRRVAASPPRNPRNNARFDDDVGDGERDERPVRRRMADVAGDEAERVVPRDDVPLRVLVGRELHEHVRAHGQEDVYQRADEERLEEIRDEDGCSEEFREHANTVLRTVLLVLYKYFHYNNVKRIKATILCIISPPVFGSTLLIR
ncbi:unnamed protein product [Bathycoccus prasinos]